MASCPWRASTVPQSFASTVQSEIEIDDLADLGAAWEKLRTSESHGDWGRELEPYIVSGTSRWEIFRVV